MVSLQSLISSYPLFCKVMLKSREVNQFVQSYGVSKQIWYHSPTQALEMAPQCSLD